MTTNTQRETQDGVGKKELELAIETVRGYQAKAFAEGLRGLTMDEYAKTQDLTNILREHGNTPATLTLTCETAVMLSHLLSQLSLPELPDLERARQNFVMAVCKTVEHLPVLVSCALGQIKTRKLTHPCKIRSSSIP